MRQPRTLQCRVKNFIVILLTLFYYYMCVFFFFETENSKKFRVSAELSYKSTRLLSSNPESKAIKTHSLSSFRMYLITSVQWLDNLRNFRHTYTCQFAVVETVLRRSNIQGQIPLWADWSYNSEPDNKFESVKSEIEIANRCLFFERKTNTLFFLKTTKRSFILSRIYFTITWTGLKCNYRHFLYSFLFTSQWPRFLYRHRICYIVYNKNMWRQGRNPTCLDSSVIWCYDFELQMWAIFFLLSSNWLFRYTSISKKLLLF